MCGLVGYINSDFSPVDAVVLKKMLDVQRHRGPDDQGLLGFSFGGSSVTCFDDERSYNAGNAHGCIGFNRLSILDLSSNGHQPMVSADSNVIIAYNGEIYNAFSYKELLREKGYSFKSKTDTEILLNLYLEFGIEGMLKRLNGMFAFCIIDLRLKKVFLVRDYMGIKPLYFYQGENSFLFASEIKSFFQHPEFDAIIDQRHVQEFLLFKNNACDRTLFKGVYQLPPGHYIEYSPESVVLKEYWTFPAYKESISDKNEAIFQLEDTLKKSVQSQLVSDVKVGCQLSGGLDSSLVTTYARQSFNANMNTFSIIPTNRNFSEAQWIDKVVEQTESDAHRYNLSPDYVIDNLYSATWHLECPLYLPHAMGIKLLAQEAKKEVTVLLSGEGSDELMGGYPWFYDLLFRQNNEHAINVLSKLPVKGRKIYRQFLPDTDADRFMVLKRMAITPANYNTIYPESDIEESIALKQELIPVDRDVFTKARIFDLRSWLANLLTIQDKMTMASSIENRVPFLDQTVIDYTFRLSPNLLVPEVKNPMKYNAAHRHTKLLLKKMAAKIYNNDFVYRKKQGFPLPIADYISHPRMKALVNDALLPGLKNRGGMNSCYFEKLWQKPEGHRTTEETLIVWFFITFEVWCQIFIDNSRFNA